MPAPPYMRFYVKSYCKATLSLTYEEQGVYMRLLCTMWEHGGKLKDDDSYISKALPIQIHKWRKVKRQLMPFLMEHSPGFLTQNKLSDEYLFSSGDKKQNDGTTTGVTTPVTRGVTPQVTPQVTKGVTPQYCSLKSDTASPQRGDTASAGAWFFAGIVAYIGEAFAGASCRGSTRRVLQGSH